MCVERKLWACRDRERTEYQDAMKNDCSLLTLRKVILPIHKPGWLPAPLLAAIRAHRNTLVPAVTSPST